MEDFLVLTESFQFKCYAPLRHGTLYRTTYLLTPWCRVLLHKPTGLKLVKKFPAFHGTRRFITALTIVRHLVLAHSSYYHHYYYHRNHH